MENVTILFLKIFICVRFSCHLACEHEKKHIHVCHMPNARDSQTWQAWEEMYIESSNAFLKFFDMIRKKLDKNHYENCCILMKAPSLIKTPTLFMGRRWPVPHKIGFRKPNFLMFYPNSVSRTFWKLMNCNALNEFVRIYTGMQVPKVVCLL